MGLHSLGLVGLDRQQPVVAPWAQPAPQGPWGQLISIVLRFRHSEPLPAALV